jgi:hypothetical protein
MRATLERFHARRKERAEGPGFRSVDIYTNCHATIILEWLVPKLASNPTSVM